MTDALFQRIPGVSLSDPNGNGALQEIQYRGFAASPLQGRPQGLAVYLNGVRVNEAFGDTVNWDLVPTNAIQRTDVWSNNPVFGLNALGAVSTLAFVNRDLSVTTGNAGVPGLGANVHTLGAVGVGPVDVTATNTYYGVYSVDTFDVTERLSATLGGRVNVATIRLRDQLGTSPELNGEVTYSRFNPLAGVAYTLGPGVSAYAGYSESNRVPTPLENGCANPARPYLIESFLVADPPLKQVVGRTYEVGLRGTARVIDGTLGFKLGVFRTDSLDDVVQVASAVQGRGSFQNVPETRRQGLEASAQYQSRRWLAYVGYSFVDATYRFSGRLPSPNNPFADEDGTVRVVSGNRVPGIPRHQAKLGLDYLVTPAWKVGGDLAVVGSQYFVGDDGNQNGKLPGYWLASLHTSYRIAKHVEVFALVTNLFDQRYALFGTFFDPQGVANAGLPIPLTVPGGLASERGT